MNRRRANKNSVNNKELFVSKVIFVGRQKQNATSRNVDAFGSIFFLGNNFCRTDEWNGRTRPFLLCGDEIFFGICFIGGGFIFHAKNSCKRTSEKKLFARIFRRTFYRSGFIRGKFNATNFHALHDGRQSGIHNLPVHSFGSDGRNFTRQKNFPRKLYRRISRIDGIIFSCDKRRIFNKSRRRNFIFQCVFVGGANFVNRQIRGKS